MPLNKETKPILRGDSESIPGTSDNSPEKWRKRQIIFTLDLTYIWGSSTSKKKTNPRAIPIFVDDRVQLLSEAAYVLNLR